MREKSSFPTSEYNFEIVYPHIAREWHPYRNGDLKPIDVMPFSHRKVWWLCKLGHEWEAAISNRSSRSDGCTICSKSFKTSFPEQAIYFYLKQCFLDTKNRYLYEIKDKKYEIDIYIPSLNLGIEYDGYHHLKNIKKDIKKTVLLESEGIKIVRVRIDSLESIEGYCSYVFIHEVRNYFPSLEIAIDNIISLINTKLDLKKMRLIPLGSLNIDLSKDGPAIRENFQNIIKANSFIKEFPYLADEWDIIKNGSLKPEYFTKGSRFKAWWVCSKGHEFRNEIKNRTSKGGTKCPYCSGKKVCFDNCLATVNPKVASEWNYKKNGKLTPYDVTFRSGKKVWWIHNECGHEWQETMHNRSAGNDCPNCRYERTAQKNRKSKESFLKEIDQLVGNEYSVLEDYVNAKTKILFKHNICGYEYRFSPDKFIRGSRCIKCYRAKVTKTHETFRKEIYELVKEEYTLLGKYINSRTKVKMKHNVCGNEYMVTPAKFLSKRRCPLCSKNKGKINKKNASLTTD